MRFIYPAAVLALFVTVGCNKPVEQQKPQADQGSAPASADVQLVSLNLPNMT